jgi:hypothetical protein
MEIHNLMLMLKISIREKHITSLTQFNWKDYNAPGPTNHSFITSRGKTFSLLQRVQTGSGAHPGSYSVGTWGSSQRGKIDGA